MDTTQTEEVTESHEQPIEEATTQEEAAPYVPVAVIDDDPHTEQSQDDSQDAAGEPAAPGVAVATASLVSAGVGLASLTGTWLGTMIANRLELAGQIKAQSGAVANPIAAVYGTPWHANALVNGVFALIAIVVAGVALLQNRAAPQWVKATAAAGLTLGVLGLIIAGAMYFDVFSALPAMPPQPGG